MSDPVSVYYDFNKQGADAFIRLGAAVVYRWDELPASIQSLLLDQAELVGGFPDADTSREATLDFVRQFKRDTFERGR